MGHTCPWDWDGHPGKSQICSPAVSGECCPPRRLWSGCWRPAWCGSLRKTSCARTGARGRFCPRWQEGRDAGEGFAGLRGSVTARTGSAHPQAPGPAHMWGFPPIASAAPYPRAPMIIIFRSTFLLASMDGPCGMRGGHLAVGVRPVPGEPRGAGGGVGAATAPRGLSRSHPGRPRALDATVSAPCQHRGRAVPAPCCAGVPAVVGAESPVTSPAHVTTQDRLPRCRCTSRHATALHQLIATKSCCEQVPHLSLSL